MDTGSGPRYYEELDPKISWVSNEGSETLQINLPPGFKKENLKVQLVNNEKLRVTGEHQLLQNKWRRFRKEVEIPNDTSTNQIKAKFETNTLYVTVPKLPKQQEVPPSVVAEAGAGTGDGAAPGGAAPPPGGGQLIGRRRGLITTTRVLVVVAIMVLVGVGIYATYKLRMDNNHHDHHPHYHGHIYDDDL